MFVYALNSFFTSEKWKIKKNKKIQYLFYGVFRHWRSRACDGRDRLVNDAET